MQGNAGTRAAQEVARAVGEVALGLQRVMGAQRRQRGSHIGPRRLNDSIEASNSIGSPHRIELSHQFACGRDSFPQLTEGHPTRGLRKITRRFATRGF